MDPHLTWTESTSTRRSSSASPSDKTNQWKVISLPDIDFDAILIPNSVFELPDSILTAEAIASRATRTTTRYPQRIKRSKVLYTSDEEDTVFSNHYKAMPTPATARTKNTTDT